MDNAIQSEDTKKDEAETNSPKAGLELNITNPSTAESCETLAFVLCGLPS